MRTTAFRSAGRAAAAGALASGRGLELAVAALAVLTVLLVVLVAVRPAWGHLDFWRARFVERPQQIYRRSAGGYDDAAALALRRAEGAPAPAPADHHLAATIIHRNILAQRPAAAAADGRELGELRRAMFGRARGHYMDALAGLADEAAAPADEAGAIIDHALEFAFGGLELLYDGPFEILVGNQDLPFEPADDALARIFGAPRFVPDHELAAAAFNRRADTVRVRRLEAAAAAAPTPGARAEAFLELSQQHTSDGQNSHDVSVNAAKRAILARLRAEAAGRALPTLDAVAAEVRAGGADFSRDPRTQNPRPALVDKAVAVVERARNGEVSSSAAASDAEALCLVWARADDPRNAPRRAQLRQAAFDALVDSWDRGIGAEHIQCVDGRISRVVGSLAWLDCDAQNWDVRRLEQHKNEVFTAAERVIKAAAEEAAAQDADPARRAVGRAYLAATAAELEAAGAVSPEAEAAWAAETRARIAAAVDEYAAAHPGAIPPHAVESLKVEAGAALEG